MSKTLLLDLTELGIPMDNVEGMTFGPSFEGRPTLILLSDNNFSPTQFTQFVAFSVTGPIPEPSTWALMAAGIALVAASVRRRRKP
jgi:hypothetical protein